MLANVDNESRQLRILLYGLNVDGCNLNRQVLEDASTVQIEKYFSPMGSKRFSFPLSSKKSSRLLRIVSELLSVLTRGSGQ